MLSGRPSVPAATAVVKNPLVADSSGEESSCGGNKGILKCPLLSPLWSHPLPGGVGRCPAACGDSSSKEYPFVADSSSEESSCGDNKEILRCPISSLIWSHLVPGGAGQRPAVSRCPVPVGGPLIRPGGISSHTPLAPTPPGVRHLEPRQKKSSLVGVLAGTVGRGTLAKRWGATRRTIPSRHPLAIGSTHTLATAMAKASHESPEVCARCFPGHPKEWDVDPTPGLKSGGSGGGWRGSPPGKNALEALRQGVWEATAP